MGHLASIDRGSWLVARDDHTHSVWMTARRTVERVWCQIASFVMGRIAMDDGRGDWVECELQWSQEKWRG